MEEGGLGEASPAAGDLSPREDTGDFWLGDFAASSPAGDLEGDLWLPSLFYKRLEENTSLGLLESSSAYLRATTCSLRATYLVLWFGP